MYVIKYCSRSEDRNKMLRDETRFRTYPSLANVTNVTQLCAQSAAQNS